MVGGFVRSASGGITAFNAGDSSFTVCYGINNAGEVTGFYEDTTGLLHGFLRSPAGSIATFEVPGSPTCAGCGTIAYAINTAGDIVGYYLDANTVSHGFLRKP